MYSNAYPPLNPSAGALAQRIFSARAIPAGTPIDDDLLIEAKLEFYSRNAALGYADITRDEVLRAENRMRAIEAEHIAAEYYGGQNPVIGAAVTAAVQQALVPINTTLLLIVNQLQRLDAAGQRRDRNIQAIANQLDVLDADGQRRDRNIQHINNQLQGIVDHMAEVRKAQRSNTANGSSFQAS